MLRRPAAPSPPRPRPPPARSPTATFTAFALLVALAVPVLLGAAISSFFNPSTAAYGDLSIPPWTPPSVVWSSFCIADYLLMGVASWLVYRDGGYRKQRNLLGIYIVQLLLNLLWPVLLFGLVNLDAALVDVYLLLITTIICVLCFATSSKVAAYLLFPYVAWVLVAAAFTTQFYILNFKSIA